VKAVPGLLEGTVVFEPEPRCAAVTRTFDAEVVSAVGVDSRGLVQECQWRTTKGVVVGLHVRRDGGEGLLVRCAHGSVLDVAVDLRPASSTYKLWMSAVLDDLDHRSVWLPPGLAHGFQTLSETSDFCLRTTRVRRAEHETTIRYDDPDLAIPWPLDPKTVTNGKNVPGSTSVVSIALIEPYLGDWFGALQ
jgi:dTDP-4-dehydrorhamnose 3,5-epimerase